MNILWYILHARQLLIIQASISLLTRFFCSSLVSQLVVNWWFELVIWILRVPLSNNPFHFRGSKHIHTTKLDVSGGQEEVHERKRRWEPWPKQEKNEHVWTKKCSFGSDVVMFCLSIKKLADFSGAMFAVDLCWCFDGSNSANHLRLQGGPKHQWK